MTAGAGALAVLIGGGAATVTTLAVGGASTTAAQHSPVTEPDLGAPALEDDPEVVSRAAAAAEPLPQRHTAAPTHAGTTVPAATDQLSRARSGDERADRTGPRPARTPVKKEPAKPAAPAPAEPPAPAAPVVTTRTDVETRAVPFPTRLVRDPSLPRGARRVQAPGVPGEETLHYEVTLTDGKPTDRRLIDTVVTQEPEPRVIAYGARRKGRDCEGRGLRLCVPLGRSAACPPEEAEPGDARSRPEDGPAELTEADLELLDRVRLEPTTLC